MRLLASFALGLWAGVLAAAVPGTYHVTGEAGAWNHILGSFGLQPAPPGEARVRVVRTNNSLPARDARAFLAGGGFLILEGDSPLARGFGILPGEQKPVPVRNVIDSFRSKLGIVWEQPVDVSRFSLPADARVFARERWEGIPLVAGWKEGRGAVLWLATDPGERGYERYPYIMQALAELGWTPPFESRRLWAFFDSSYRLRADVDYLAARWRRAGIAALHVAAWHYYEPDAARDEYLKRLLDACHENNIQVYAWLELPHVSEKFWLDHPEWREKTALGQDAHLDWRKLMDLANPDCAREVERGTLALLQRFDWDGVNLAELYFESLEGYANPARFTPMSATVRAGFKAQHGFDPAELYVEDSPHFHKKTASSMRLFLNYRAALAERLQQEWIARLELVRAGKPDLDLVLTHVDDRFDTTMRDKIGADAARLVPLAETRQFTFLVEDPATIWHLGPQRYTEIARRYTPLTRDPSRLAIDINIVERYQDVYPTKQQTGGELFQLVHLASEAFARVALYFENSILAPDLPLLPASSSAVRMAAWKNGSVRVDSLRGTGIRWSGASALVDGKIWPVANEEFVWLPRGEFELREAAAQGNMSPIRVLDLNADLLAAASTRDGLRFEYTSEARAYARLDKAPRLVTVNGKPVTCNGTHLILPRGRHRVEVVAGR